MSKIEWCDKTWNPITGCKHGCVYCYARKIAKRFRGVWDGDSNVKTYLVSDAMQKVTGREFDGHGLKYFVGYDSKGEPKLINAPYPYGFHPTLHIHRLETGVQRWKHPRNIFVCAMADLFGAWVSYEWIDKVFDVCNSAPQHRFLFLTKNPKRYMELYNVLPRENNFFYGTTVTTADTEYWYSENHNWFLSIEPIMEKFPAHSLSGSVPLMDGPGIRPKWVIVGAETGNRKGKVIPKKEWIETIVDQCRFWGIPLFLKNNLAPVWGEPLIQEYPWKTLKTQGVGHD